jgi:hypothetical protein
MLVGARRGLIHNNKAKNEKVTFRPKLRLQAPGKKQIKVVTVNIVAPSRKKMQYFVSTSSCICIVHFCA